MLSCMACNRWQLPANALLRLPPVALLPHNRQPTAVSSLRWHLSQCTYKHMHSQP